MNKAIVPLIVFLLGGGLGFYGGMVYAKKNQQSVEGQEERRQRLAEFRNGGGQANGSGTFQRGNALGNGVNGDILKITDKDFIVELPDKSTRLVLLSKQTEITRSAKANLKDLKVGDQVRVVGAQNEDGSMTARMVQIGTLSSPRTEKQR